MDALTVLSVVLLAACVWRVTRSLSPLGICWILVIGLTTARTLGTAHRDVAFFRLLLLAGAWLVYALAYRYHMRIERAMPYLATAAIAVTVVWVVLYGEPVGWLWDRNITADVLLLLVPWLRGPTTFMFGLVPMAIAVTGSRGALLGLVGALLWLIARPRWYVWSLLVGALAIGLVFIRPATAQIRLDIWLDAARMIIARPLTGWGIGATLAGGHAHAHNVLLDAWVNGGPLLMAAWALFLCTIITLIVGPPGSRARLGLLAVILHGLVDCEVFTPVILFAAVNLALLVRYRECESKNSFSECAHSGDRAPGVTATA